LIHLKLTYLSNKLIKTTAYKVEIGVGEDMVCIKTEIPQEICDIYDELKAIYHSKDTLCI
jgi:hypothetical protein